MSNTEPTAVWHAYIEKVGYEPSNASQLQKWSKTSAAKQFQSLSFKEASKIFKQFKGIKATSPKTTNKNKKRKHTFGKSNKFKKNAPKKIKKPKQIRSKLNNNAEHESLDSILEILRRATLLKKQQQMTKEQQQSQQQIVSADAEQNNVNNKEDTETLLDTTKESENDNESGNILKVSTDNGPKPPPDLFRNDSEWDWTKSDIVFSESLNYGISLHLLHLELTKGPLFPNSILKWNRLKFKENGPTARTGHVALGIDDKMVIFGGYCKEMLTDHIFLVDTNDFDVNVPLEVTPISSLEKIHKTYRVGHCGVSLTHNNCLYLFGGWNGQNYINHGLLFNVDSLKLVSKVHNEQTKDRILPPPRRDHSLCKMGPYMLLFGGWSHDYDGNELWLLGSNWKWQQLEVTGTPPCSRRGHSANVIGSNMFLFGGLYGFSKYLNDLHIYNGDDNNWIQPELVGSTRPPARAWHSTNIVGTSQILMFGGTAGRSGFLNDCWVFDTVGYFWFQIECHGQSPLPRCSHSKVKIMEDAVFVNDPWLNECIKIDKDGKVENAENRKDRLRLIMFGGLVAIKHEIENEMDGKKEDNDGGSGGKKKEKRVNNKGGGVKEKDRFDLSLKIVQSDDEKDYSDEDESDKSSSESEQEEDMTHINTIELSDDLFVLTLEM